MQLFCSYFCILKSVLLETLQLHFCHTGQEKKAGAAGGGVVASENDLEKMRGSIQVLVQHTGPLGTCMDYIQEDVSLMTAELHRWEEECRK